ncbi:MAG: rhodanese-like domain-containing protein, partial [Candidatus Hydrothermarchaeaceae archaeon]
MVRKMMKSILILAILLFSVSQVSAQRTDEFNVVMNAAIATAGAQTVITAAPLKTALDGNNGNTPLVLDVRDYNTGYAAGHIPGAISIYYRDLGTASALNSLDSALASHISAGKKNEIVTYGNTRHLSRMTATYLKTQGYTVKALAMGLSEWTSSAPGRFIDCTSFDGTGRGNSPAGCTSNNFPTTTANTINAATQSGEGYPNIDCISGSATSSDLAAITRCTYNARFGDLSKPDFRVNARELYDLLNDADSTNDPYVLSNRGTTWGSPY